MKKIHMAVIVILLVAGGGCLVGMYWHKPADSTSKEIAEEFMETLNVPDKYTENLYRQRETKYDLKQYEFQKSFESLVTPELLAKSNVDAEDLTKGRFLYSDCLVGAWRYRAGQNFKKKISPSLKAKTYEVYCIPEEVNLYASMIAGGEEEEQALKDIVKT